MIYEPNLESHICSITLVLRRYFDKASMLLLCKSVSKDTFAEEKHWTPSRHGFVIEKYVCVCLHIMESYHTLHGYIV